MVGHIGIADVDQAYKVLTTDSSQVAVGVVFGLLSAFLFVMAAWDLYLLLRPVNPDLALRFLLLNAIGVAIQVRSYFPLLFALLSTNTSNFMQAFSADQIEGLQQIGLHWNWLNIVVIWVNENLRRRGIGRQLLAKA